MLYQAIQSYIDLWDQGSKGRVIVADQKQIHPKTDWLFIWLGALTLGSRRAEEEYSSVTVGIMSSG